MTRGASHDTLLWQLEEGQYRLHRVVDDVLFESDLALSLDLSHGTNRLSPPRAFSDALLVGLADRSLRSEYSAPQGPVILRERIARSESVRSGLTIKTEQVMAVHGASEGLLLAALYLRQTGRRSALVLGPQFPTVFRSLEAVGLSVVMAVGPRSAGYEVDVDAAISVMKIERPDVIALSQPANPGGTLLSEAEMSSIVRAAAEVEAVVLYDRVQSDIPSDWWVASAPVLALGETEGAELIVVDSWSKRRSIPGMRIGFVVASPEIISWMKSAVVGRTVSTVPLYAVLADLEMTDPVWLGGPLSLEQAQYVLEVNEAHQLCDYNKTFALSSLQPWLLGSSKHSAGMNFWVDLNLDPPMSEEDVVKHLAFGFGLGSYPVECFVPKVGDKLVASAMIRLTTSSPRDEFAATIRRLVVALEDGFSKTRRCNS